MKSEPRVLARDVIDVFAEHFSLPKAFVRQVINALKVAGRIDAARPVSPPVTPRAIARITLALTSPTIRDAVDTEQYLGALNLIAGDGQPCLEDALTDMIEEAAGWRNGGTNFRDGTVYIGHDTDTAFVDKSRYAGKAPAKVGLQKITLITTRAISQIARELLPQPRGVAKCPKSP